MRNQKRYIKLSRGVIANRLKADRSRRIKTKVASLKAQYPDAKPRFGIGDFLKEKIWKWLEHSVKHLLGTKHHFKIYDRADKGVYLMSSQNPGSPITIALAADWASNTEESIAIADQIKKLSPDYTIHLGDTYYTGELNEISDNFLKANAPWPRGAKGTFALMGNHEMYSMARSYYDALLPGVGLFDKASNKYLGQGASFFSLCTDRWIVIGLDTGYNSVGFPFVWNSLKTNGELPEGLVEWLTIKVKPNVENRGIVFLSHHQYVSAFKGEKNFARPAEQLAEIFGQGKSVIWIWGHEHRFALYKKYSSLKGITAYGRCIGHGGMPVELDEVVDKSRAGASALVAVDKRMRTLIGTVAVGYNGFSLVRFDHDKLTIEYYDQNGLMLEENWKVDANGVIAGVSITPRFQGKDFEPQPARNWNDAIN